MFACSTCSTKGRVLETYNHQGGTVRRRYACPACGERWNTLEFRQKTRMTHERALAILADRVLLVPAELAQ